jgi:hypothetical protein
MVEERAGLRGLALRVAGENQDAAADDDRGDAVRSAIAARFPGVAIQAASAIDPAPVGEPTWTAAAWRSEQLDFWAFDRSLDALAAGGGWLRLSAPPSIAVAVAGEILIRAQRLLTRRNPASAGAWFDRVLAAHRARHDLDRPLVRADLDHAIDTWQWTLRLDPDAPPAVQLAALLHDVERLVSEADARIEHRAADYQAFKDAHARAGARLAEALLRDAGVDAAVIAETTALIAVHERASDAPALRAINDADALSFFSLNSPGYLAYFGPGQTDKKVAYTLARMSPRARRELAGLRLPGPVRARIEHGDLGQSA